jgi:hypothetical protein
MGSPRDFGCGRDTQEFVSHLIDLDERASPAHSPHVIGHFVHLGRSCPACFKEGQEGFFCAYHDPSADQGPGVRGQAVDKPIVAMHEVYKDAHP